MPPFPNRFPPLRTRSNPVRATSSRVGHGPSAVTHGVSRNRFAAARPVYGPDPRGGSPPDEGPAARPAAGGRYCSARSRTRSSSSLRSATSFRTSRAVSSSGAPALTISAVRRTWARACPQGPSWSGGMCAAWSRNQSAFQDRAATSATDCFGAGPALALGEQARPTRPRWPRRVPAPARRSSGPPGVRRRRSPAPRPRRPPRPGPARRPTPGTPRPPGPGPPRCGAALPARGRGTAWRAAPVHPRRRTNRGGRRPRRGGPPRPREDLRAAADIGRLPGQDLAEDRPQGEDIGLLVEALDFALRLLRAHVGRSADDRPRLRGQAAAGRAYGRHQRFVDPPVLDSGSDLPPRPDGGPSTSPQSTTCTSPKAPTMMFDGLRSRWITPRAWA